MNFLKKIFNTLNSVSESNKKTKKELEELKLLMGKSLIQNLKNASSLQEAEFKVFSQWGDDGIIQFLINNINITSPYFVEFGVENYLESNTRFLLINNNWSGLIMDGSASHMDFVKADSIYWRHDLTAKQAFVTAENINQLLDSENVPDKIGILHIDIDGNDYWVWKSINRVMADIVIVEYNSLFGPDRSITIPYKADFYRTNAHYSNLFYGSSLLSLVDLAKEKGYAFVGCNSAGNNAYFVKNEKLGNLKSISAAEGFVLSKFKESRDENGVLTFLRDNERNKCIQNMEVYNTRTNSLEKY